MKNLTVKLTSLAFACALTACGGGGGGAADPAASTTAATTVSTTTPVLVTSNIVTAVPVATYAAGSEELAAFTLLNAERTSCGFGKLVQNATLDVAAVGHADWLLINGYIGHFQITGTTGFTGVAPDDRLVAAGYGPRGSFMSNAEAQNDNGGAKTGLAINAIRVLLNAPYHALEMVRGYRDVGVGVRDKFDVGLSPNNRNYLNMNFGYKNSEGPQVAAAGSVRTYPCEGSSGIEYALYNESPSPAPSRDLRLNPLGSSIGIVVDVGNTLVITSASMIKVSTGAAITLRAPVVAANDPNAINGVSYFKANEGFVSADTPLEPNTQYQVTITGTSSSKAFSRQFSFTTKS